MKTNKAGVDLIKRFEGCSLKAYKCPGDVWTVGWGHTSNAGPPRVTAGTTISQALADETLLADLVTFEHSVAAALTKYCNENQFAAMVSLAYNIGAGAFKGSSVCRHFNDGQPQKAASAFLLWNKANGKEMLGLKRRRAAEMVLFSTPVQRTGPMLVPPPVQPDPTVPDVIAADPPAWPPVVPPKPGYKPSIQVVMGILAAIAAVFATYLGFK